MGVRALPFDVDAITSSGERQNRRKIKKLRIEKLRKTLMDLSKKRTDRVSVFQLLMVSLVVGCLGQTSAFASEAELHIPELNTIFQVFGSTISGTSILG